MSRITPTLKSKGLYVLRAPWSVPPTTTYVCQAVRGLRDIFEMGDDPFKLYYEPMGLTEADFKADLALDVNIVTLMVEALDASTTPLDKSYVYVPDTYIERYPDQSFVPYSHIVLSLSLGLLPDSIALDTLKAEVANVCSNVIGVTPVVKEHIVPTNGSVSASQHETLEIARRGLITLRDTDYARLQRQIANNQLLQEQINTLVKILEDNGLLPPP